MSYWTAMGFGISIDDLYNEKLFKPDAVMYFLNLDLDESIGDEIYDHFEPREIAEFIISTNEVSEHKCKGLLTKMDTGKEEGGGTFVLYAPPYPWVMSEIEKTVTKEDMEYSLVDDLRWLTTLSGEELKKRIIHIHEHGWE